MRDQRKKEAERKEQFEMNYKKSKSYERLSKLYVNYADSFGKTPLHYCAIK